MALDEVIISSPVSVKETVALGLDHSTNPRIVHEIAPLLGAKLTGSTTPPVTKVWEDNVALTAGAKTLDLEALVNANLPNVNFVGLKVQILVFSVPAGNSPITITSGAVNGYDIGGAASSWAIGAGGQLILLLNETAPDVAAADSEIDFAGTGSETFDILMVAG